MKGLSFPANVFFDVPNKDAINVHNILMQMKQEIHNLSCPMAGIQLCIPGYIDVPGVQYIYGVNMYVTQLPCSWWRFLFWRRPTITKVRLVIAQARP